MESFPSITWTESGQTPVLTESSSSRVHHGHQSWSRQSVAVASTVAAQPVHVGTIGTKQWAFSGPRQYRACTSPVANRWPKPKVWLVYWCD
jgi:hypothetical protein